jgi:Holliday junction DNA helicase RuvA
MMLLRVPEQAWLPLSDVLRRCRAAKGWRRKAEEKPAIYGMIGKLTGVVDSVGEDFAVLDVHGVGYIVHCSARTLQKLPRPGEAAVLAIETQLREESLKLFGFLSEAEREWFRLLQSVQGVGAKVALAIQTVLDAQGLAAAIACQDKGALARAPGVGPKLAARIIAELKDKAAARGSLNVAAQRPAGLDGGEPAAAQDAVSALVNLGYARGQAEAAVAASLAALGEAAPAAELIRSGLKQLTR